MTTIAPVWWCPECDLPLPHDEHECWRCGFSVVPEINELLAEQDEPTTCAEELERLRDRRAA